MASNFHIQKPYVLNALPRPLDPATGRYVVGEVYGTAEGSRKRKRSELTVGIDGEALNIYDISSARLVTSYPIPPQSSFTCASCSLRRRIPGNKEVIRYTYIATRDPSQRVTLFKDHVDPSGKTTSSTNSLALASQNPVVHLTTRSPPGAKSNDTLSPSTGDELLVIRRNGEIIGLDAESLQQKWITNPAVLYQDFARGSKKDFHVEHCISASTSDVIQGMFKGSRDSLSGLASASHDNSDPELLIVVSSLPMDGQNVLHLHILSQMPLSQTLAYSSGGLLQLYVAPMVSPPRQADNPSAYQLDVRSGSFLELSDGTLTVYDLTESIPKVTHIMDLGDASSFLKMSKTSVLSCTASQLNVYNPQFRSIQSSTSIDLEGQTQSSHDLSGADSCELVAYFSKLELAIGITNGHMVAIQLEAPKTRTKKRRAEGLLIDSIGRGVQQPIRTDTSTTANVSTNSAFSNYLPGSVRGDYWETWTQGLEKADALLESDQLEEFEALLAEKVGLRISKKKLTSRVMEDGEEAQPLPEWKWPKSRSEYPRVDRRWILYGISKAFRWHREHGDDAKPPRLICSLPYTNIVTYLVDAGHLTVSNLKSALRDQLRDVDNVDSVLARLLISRLAELDPTLELLTCYISATTLGSTELLLAVRAIMQSLELIQDPKQSPPKLLTNVSSEEAETENAEFGMELDNLEEEIQKTESYLNGNTGIRGTGLSVAFAKLANCPAVSTIKALRSTFKPEEILSLVYLLRVELVKGAWTSRYLDNTEFEEDAELDAPPDGIITLISDLLGRCIDAIGPGGWLLNDALLGSNNIDDSGDFVASLKLEVSAALEGLQEAVYLRGIVGEAVKYCEAAQKAEAQANAMLDVTKPMPLYVREPGAEALPLGLKTKTVIEKTKVVSGGEVVRRTARETGHLRSQQVGPYSLERIAI
ncbi:uncharacterized protein BCR38DRAFT_394408 [Pseudomassariella vexata]|uniref:Utp8 beta-propeller domain-containing protein n=1 Tax=Pseudomassariella vexata TaxID=1141098 RepID=A0A1Y2DVZ0_9PEZI|nr:uncharacterized protein BCR38DRAFT_394408 [Pseudomassariella vexata]ORY63451.1 hypothetical protein BCR38DRAFT_394408 [Pseudomassariella vexata]